MSKKSHPPAEKAHVDPHEHDDDLIVAPKGASRLRFFLTLAMVILILIIFVVADNLQSVLGGSGAAGDETTMTWTDPLSGDTEAIDGIHYEQTSQLLNRLAELGLYRPDTLLYVDSTTRRRTVRVEDSDVTSFIVYEDMAIDAGIAISKKEHLDFLKLTMRESANLAGAARRFAQSSQELENDIRRVRRVEKLKELLRSGTRLGDPDALVTDWQSDHPEFRFEYVELTGDPFIEGAQGEVPSNEDLLTWWREKPIFEQQQLWSPEATVPQIAWLDLDGNYDGTALLEAFPRPEGVELDKLAEVYYEGYKAVRFANPVPEPAVDEDGALLPDGDQPEFEPHVPFTEVQETALAEAQLEASLRDLIADLQDKIVADDEVDLVAVAEQYGLQSFTAPQGMTREDMAAEEAWGNQNLAQRLAFGAEGQLLGSVVIDGGKMYLGRVLERLPKAEPPVEEIAPSVSKRWVTSHALELATESLAGLAASMAEKPADHPQDEPWTPNVSAADFAASVQGAGYEVLEREWRERSEIPKAGYAAMSEAGRYLRNETPLLYEMEEGQVAEAATSIAGRAYLVRVAGKRLAPVEDLTPEAMASLPAAARSAELKQLGAKIFVGDSEWFMARFKVSYPERERRAAEEAAAQG